MVFHSLGVSVLAVAGIASRRASPWPASRCGEVNWMFRGERTGRWGFALGGAWDVPARGSRGSCGLWGMLNYRA